MPWTEIKIILTTLAITLLPGWALLSLTGYCFPYFTKRKTTTGTMFLNLNPEHAPYLKMEPAE